MGCVAPLILKAPSVPTRSLWNTITPLPPRALAAALVFLSIHQAVAARLSQALGRLLEKNLVVVPCPSSDSPSLSSLCEQTPAYAETEENHAKVTT